MNRRTQRHSKDKKEKTKNINKKVPPWNGRVKYFTGGLKPVSLHQPHHYIQMWMKTHRYLVCMKDPKLINASSPRTYESRYNKEIKQR